MAKTVGIVGTLDTKGIEFQFIKERIEVSGTSTCVVNTGILGEPYFEPDVSAGEVAEAGGTSLQALQDGGDRGVACGSDGGRRSEDYRAIAERWKN